MSRKAQTKCSARLAKGAKDTPDAGRDPNTGRFTEGCKPGPGNPYAAKVAEYRRMVYDVVEEEDMRAVVRAHLVKAKGGDVAAMKLLYEYTIGRPMPLVETFEKERRPIRIIYSHETKPSDDDAEHDEHETEARHAELAAQMRPQTDDADERAD